MTAPLPPLPEPDGIGIEIYGGKWYQDWISRQDAFNGDALQSYAKLAVRDALKRIVKKADRGDGWVEIALEDIEAMLKEYE